MGPLFLLHRVSRGTRRPTFYLWASGSSFPLSVGVFLLELHARWPVSPRAFALSSIKVALTSLAIFLRSLSHVTAVPLFLEPLAGLPSLSHHPHVVIASVGLPDSTSLGPRAWPHFIPLSKPRSWLTIPALSPQQVPCFPQTAQSCG